MYPGGAGERPTGDGEEDGKWRMEDGNDFVFPKDAINTVALDRWEDEIRREAKPPKF
jgi:hypothetical protein